MAPADGRRSAAYPDTGAPLACGNQTQCDGVRQNRQALSGEGPDSAVARLRCHETSGRDAEGRSAFARSRRARRSDSRGRRLIGSLRGDSIPAGGAAYAGNVRPYVLHCDMADTITIRTDEETEYALDVLTHDGSSRSAAIRQAVLEAARRRERAAEMRRAVLRMDLGQPDGVNVAEELARDRTGER